MTVVTFEVIGNGQIYLEINLTPVGNAFPDSSKSINLNNGDTLSVVLIPYIGSSVLSFCDVPQTECQTASSYILPVTDASLIPTRMIATFGTSSPVTINSFIVGEDNYPNTRTRNFAVQGTGTGTYQIKEGSTVITTRTLPASGFDTFDLTNIPAGSHIYCAGSRCVTFTIVTDPQFNKWTCHDGCNVADTTGDYNSQAECKAACIVPPPGNSLALVVDKAIVTVGDTVKFKASFDRPDGTVINLYQAIPLGSDFLVGTGSLVGGYVTIPHTFALAGTAVYYACSPGLIDPCGYESNRITITIADKTTTYIIYAVGALALAYIAGQYLSSRNRGKVK